MQDMHAYFVKVTSNSVQKYLVNHQKHNYMVVKKGLLRLAQGVKNSGQGTILLHLLARTITVGG